MLDRRLQVSGQWQSFVLSTPRKNLCQPRLAALLGMCASGAATAIPAALTSLGLLLLPLVSVPMLLLLLLLLLLPLPLPLTRITMATTTTTTTPLLLLLLLLLRLRLLLLLLPDAANFSLAQLCSLAGRHPGT